MVTKMFELRQSDKLVAKILVAFFVVALALVMAFAPAVETVALANQVQETVQAINASVDGIVDGFKDFFGIHSPSRVMANLIGKFLPQGIALGFDKEMPKSLDKMERTLDLANEGLSVRVSQLANTSGGAMASNYYGNTYTNNDNTQVINFYNTVDDPIENARRIRLAERNGYAR